MQRGQGQHMQWEKDQQGTGAHDRDIEELRRFLEGVLDGVPVDLCLQIWEEGILELCIGGDPY
jgi:hypothetical protein